MRANIRVGQHTCFAGSEEQEASILSFAIGTGALRCDSKTRTNSQFCKSRDNDPFAYRLRWGRGLVVWRSG